MIKVAYLQTKCKREQKISENRKLLLGNIHSESALMDDAYSECVMPVIFLNCLEK